MGRYQSVTLEAEPRYRVRHGEGEYFMKWQSTGWDTVKRFALWTTDQKKAAVMTMKELDQNNYIELVCGFTNLKLEEA